MAAAAAMRNGIVRLHWVSESLEKRPINDRVPSGYGGAAGVS